MSKVSFRQFNQEPKDVYPDITYCLEGTHLKKSIEELQVSVDTFSDIMKGNLSSNSKDENISNHIYHLNSDLFFTDWSEVLLLFNLKTNANLIHYTKGIKVSEQQKRKINSVFHTNYIDPTQKCFTRNSWIEQGKGTLRREDDIILDLRHTLNKTNLKIFLHYPYQFVRNIERHVVEVDMKRYWISKKVTLLLSDVTTLRRRNKANEPCNDKQIDDDLSFRTKVVQNAKCKPTYWKSLAIELEIDKTPIQLCRTSNEHRQVYKSIKNISEILASSAQPCNEMLVSATVQNKMMEYDPPGQIHILVRYSTSQYQQIVNVRDFDFDSMFSAIDGFVGIFLGYSLLQTTDFIELTISKKWRNAFVKVKNSVYHFYTTCFRKGIELEIYTSNIFSHPF